MLSSGYLDRSSGMLSIETRLLRQAKAGDINAFVELCMPCVEWVYRYIHFLVPNNRVAEGLTIQVFFKAWEQLDRYHMASTFFLSWLYTVAHVRVMEHHRTHKLRPVSDNPITLAARGDEFREEYQIIRDGLRVLTNEKQNVLILKHIIGMPDKDVAYVLRLQSGEIPALRLHALCDLAAHLNNSESKTITREFSHILETCLNRLTNGTTSLKECLLRHPQYSSQLEPVLETALLLDQGHGVRPVPAFINYTQEVLTQYLRLRPHRTITVPATVVRRLALSFAMLVAAFLATGTAYAQSAMPGDTMYGWKRASEIALRSIAPRSVTVDVMFVERRLSEWISVAEHPVFGSTAKDEYEEALSRLESNEDAEENTLIAATLQTQQEELANAGLSSPELDTYLREVAASLPENANPQAPVQFVITATPTVIAPASASTEEVTENCPPKCGTVNGNNGNNPGSNNGNNGNNAGGNNGNNGNNAGGNDGNNGNDEPNGKSDNNGGGQDKNNK